jgi:diguanylate cyclase (GGDEF)-like protein/PAS domain S-box-containing protein
MGYLDNVVVFIIDDNPANLKVLNGFMKLLGWKVHIAQDGESGIEKILKVLPDIILLDILMPGIDGFETCRRLKGLPQTQEIPIIFISALTNTEHVVKGLSLGAVDYLSKPLRREEVIARIKTQLKIKSLTQELTQKNQDLQIQLEENKRKELEIRSSEEKFSIAFNCTPQPILICTPTQGSLLEVNDSFAQFLGLTKTDIIGKTTQELSFWRSPQLEQTILEQIQNEGKVRDQEVRLQNNRGEECTMMLSADSIRFNGIQAVLMIFLDITQRLRAEEKVKILSQACEQSPISIVITDSQGNIDYVNPKFEQISGYSLAEVKGKNPRVLKSGHTSPNEYRNLWQQISSGQEWHGEFHNQKKNGEMYWEKASISSIRNPQGIITHYVAIKEDITLQKKQEAMLFYQANYDAVTGLPNRNLGKDQLKKALDHGQRNNHLVGVMFVDLDNFKKVNDTLGHNVGDLLLKEVGQRLVRSVRRSDTVARLGGDEFLIVVAKVKASLDLALIAKRILGLLRQPISLNSHDLLVNGSVGIAIFPEDGYSLDELLCNADTAMYAAKADGRNTFKFFTSHMNEVAQNRLRLEGQLRQALAHQELFLQYQPFIHLPTGTIVGAECLMRWHNSLLGAVAPDQFIPIAEEMGLIIELGEWVLRKVFQYLGASFAGPNFFWIAVNTSPRQLQDNYFIEMVEAILKETGTSSHQLELEMTEQILLDNHPDVLETLAKLGAMNISLSIDDFGTGYSSLTYLHRFQFNRLKIDRSFIQQIPEDQSMVGLVKAIIALAHHLQLEVIAEGIETETQWRFLQEQGCDFGQGHYFSQAVSEAELLQLLSQQPFRY